MVTLTRLIGVGCRDAIPLSIPLSIPQALQQTGPSPYVTNQWLNVKAPYWPLEGLFPVLLPSME